VAEVEVIYINTEEDDKGSHNKFWSYEIDGSSVIYRWGRVGRTPQSKTKSYSDRDLQKLIQEKIGKGYVASSQQKLKDEVATAQEMGTQYKIKKIQFVRRQDAKSLTLHRLDRYDPNHHVLVEIINSWKKNVTRLLLSKNETLEVIGGITEAGDQIGINRVEAPSGAAHTFASAVRNLLKRLSQAVTAIVKKVSFAALGRSLFDEDDAEENAVAISASPSYLEEISKIDSAGVDSSVISTFASMGRALEF
jgi:predicted DNA-binding WGR domain protein